MMKSINKRFEKVHNSEVVEVLVVKLTSKEYKLQFKFTGTDLKVKQEIHQTLEIFIGDDTDVKFEKAPMIQAILAQTTAMCNTLRTRDGSFHVDPIKNSVNIALENIDSQRISLIEDFDNLKLCNIVEANVEYQDTIKKKPADLMKKLSSKTKSLTTPGRKTPGRMSDPIPPSENFEEDINVPGEPDAIEMTQVVNAESSKYRNFEREFSCNSTEDTSIDLYDYGSIRDYAEGDDSTLWKDTYGKPARLQHSSNKTGFDSNFNSTARGETREDSRRGPSTMKHSGENHLDKRQITPMQYHAAQTPPGLYREEIDTQDFNLGVIGREGRERSIPEAGGKRNPRASMTKGERGMGVSSIIPGMQSQIIARKDPDPIPRNRAFDNNNYNIVVE